MYSPMRIQSFLQPLALVVHYSFLGAVGMFVSEWKNLIAVGLLAGLSFVTNQACAFPPSSPTVSVNGQCGSANGVAVSVAPTGGLCAARVASAVSGSGPWSGT